MVYLHTGPMGVHRACFFIARAGEPLPRSGIAREINLLSCASCLSSRTNSRALGKIGILSHEGMDATDRPYLGACDRQSLPSGVKMPENVQNEANPESTQSPLPLDVESSVPEPAGQKRSQSGRNNAPRSTPERLLVEGLRLYPVDPRTYCCLMPNHCLSCSTPRPT